MHTSRSVHIIALLLGAVICAGCGQPETVDPTDKEPVWWDTSRSEALRHDLQVFENNFENQVEDTASRILQNTSKRGIRMAALAWKTRLLDRLEEKTRETNPIVAMLDTWALAVRQRQYLAEGEGKDIFGDQQGLAIATAKGLEQRAEMLAKRYIPNEQEPQLEKEIAEYAGEHPFTGLFEQAKATSLSTDKTALETFGSILTLPLAPLASAERFGKGVQNFNVTAARFTDTLSELPADTRWQMEVLLMNLDTNPAIESLLKSLAQVSESSQAYAEIARELPGELRSTLNTSVEQTASETRPLVDLAAWRIAQLLLLAFVLAVVLVLLIRFTHPKRCEDTPGD
jgi:hypothetical protein